MSTAKSLWALRRARRDPLGFLVNLASHGDVVPFDLAGQPTFLVSDPELIEDVLVSSGQKFAKPPALDRSARLLGRGLLTAEGPLHAARRRLIQPAFYRTRLAVYADTMVREARARSGSWERASFSIDVSREMSDLTLAIVGRTLFESDLQPHADAIRAAVAAAVTTFDPLVALVAPRRHLRPTRAQLGIVVDALIAAHAASASDDGLLALLVSARGEHATTEQLHDDVTTLLLAGHDTISLALTWTWTLLATHPEAEASLHSELDEVLGDRDPSFDDLPRLPYVRAVMSEALRLRPPAWIVARRAIEAHVLRGTVIPTDALVLMSPYVVHRDSRFFDRPLAFRPERWLASDGGRPRLAYFPFGAGRRACIGESFAWTEGMLVLATLAKRWRFVATGAAPAPEPRITLRPRGAVEMRLESRVLEARHI